MKHRWLLLVLVVGLRSALACEGIVVTQAWLREPPPGAAMAAAYFILTNHGSNEVTVTGISSVDFEHVSLHETRYVNGSASMRPIGELVVPSASEYRAEPGGAHVMLGGPRVALNEGATVRLDLICNPGPALEFVVPVRRHAPAISADGG